MTAAEIRTAEPEDRFAPAVLGTVAMRMRFPPTMRHAERLRSADEAALEAYASARERGGSPVRALSTAILCWLAHCGWADGREARARVREVLLRTRTMGPGDYEDWRIIALGDDVWGAGAPAAIHRLSLDCRTLEIREGHAVETAPADEPQRETAGAEA